MRYRVARALKGDDRLEIRTVLVAGNEGVALRG